MRNGWFKSCGNGSTEIDTKQAVELMNKCELQINPRYSDVGRGYVQYDNREFPGVTLVLRTVWWE